MTTIEITSSSRLMNPALKWAIMILRLKIKIGRIFKVAYGIDV